MDKSKLSRLKESLGWFVCFIFSLFLAALVLILNYYTIALLFSQPLFFQVTMPAEIPEFFGFIFSCIIFFFWICLAVIECLSIRFLVPLALELPPYYFSKMLGFKKFKKFMSKAWPLRRVKTLEALKSW